MVALIRARPVVEMWRGAGLSFEEIVAKCPKTANPLELSPRQLARIYEGPEKYRWHMLKRVFADLDAREKKGTQIYVRR